MLSFTCNYERFPLPLGAWDGLRYFIVVLPWSSIYKYFAWNDLPSLLLRVAIFSFDTLWTCEKMH